MKNKNTVRGAVVLIILAAAFLLNPKKEKHVEKVLPVSPLIPKETAAQVLHYHNYYLFSTTTDVLTNKRQSFGILGIVFQ
jgi:hypothetical protein